MKKTSVVGVFSAFFTLILTACQTTPMYHEGDVHLQHECGGDQSQCEKDMQTVCTGDLKGTVGEVEFVTEHDRLMVHLTCQVPQEDKKDEEQDEKGDDDDGE